MTEGEICGTLTEDFVVNTGVLKTEGTLNGDGSNFTPWTPMNVKRDVKVTLNGASKTISGLYFNNGNTNYVGLFGEVKGTVSISDLGVRDSYFKGYNDVGGLVGDNYIGGKLSVTNSYNAGVVSGSGDYVGGLVGGCQSTLTITNSYHAGTVSGNVEVGGLVGKVFSTLTITNSYNSGTVSGSDYGVGGLVGMFSRSASLTITNSYHAGTVSGNTEVGGLVGGGYGTLTITNSFFLATGKGGDDLGGEAKTLDDFHNGTVAFLMHNWCEKDGDNCKVGGLNGSIWGQNFTKENSLPDLSGEFVGRTLRTLTLHTFKDDTRKLPTIYLEGLGLELPTDLTRENHIFLGWSAKETAESFADIVTSIAKNETGAKTFYAQWMKVNEKGCYEIASGIGLYTFAGYVNNATDGSKVCGTLTKDIVVNTGVLNNDGALNGNGSNFIPWTPMNVKSGVQVAFDGNGKTISGLYFNDGNINDIGLFGGVDGTVSVSNLGLVDFYIRGGVSVGSFVASSRGKMTFANSYSAGVVNGGWNVGGLVGYHKDLLTIENCFSTTKLLYTGQTSGALIGVTSNATGLTITNSFFLGKGDNYGGTGKSAEEFHNGTVALLLHNWCEMDGDNCKVGGLDGSIWGQDFTKENSLPDLSGKFVGGTPRTLTLHTFKGDTRKLPTIYLEGLGLELPTDLTRENHIFLGWSAKETAGSSADIVTSIAKNATGAKEFYAQWMKVNEKGCYEIASGIGLYTFAGYVNNATDGSQICGMLVDNIVVNTGVLNNDGALNGDGSSFTPWNPIKVTSGKKVTLDGNGKTISGLYFNNEKNDYVGLFGDVLGAVSISNLGVKDSYFKGRNNVGGLVGYNGGANAKLTIENSYNSGTVSGTSWYVGGLVGFNYEGTLTITNSYNSGTVSGTGYYVGGLVGYNVGTLTITNSYNSGTVSGSKDNVGGLVGYNVGTLTITNSYNAGAVNGINKVGGLVGYNGESLTITNSYNSGTVSGSRVDVSGLVGYNVGTLTITNSYNSGTVSGNDNFVGGLVGENYGTLTITNSYNEGTVSGGYYVGGLVGYNGESLTITNSFFLATGKSGDDLGGEAKTLDDFHNGTVAFLLHNWCEKSSSGECKEDGLDGSVWGQDFTKENSLPDLSGKFVGGIPRTLTLHTFEGDTRKLPTIYLEGSEFELPTDLTRENYVFLGWSAKETAESFADIVTSIAKNATGAKTFYAQWKELNADGCFEIASTVELYGFANVVNNATDGSQICGMLVDNIVVNTGVLNNDGTLNGDGSGFTPWTPMNVKSGVQVTFNGNGKTISGLYFNDGNINDIGLFGGVDGTVSVSNLGLVDFYIRGGVSVGSFVASSRGKMTFANSYSAGVVNGGWNVGGLVGYHKDLLTIENCFSTTKLLYTGQTSGALIGVTSNATGLTITNSFFLGKGDNYGGTGKSAEEFHNGTVALLLHDWCETISGSDKCKVGGLNGSVWGQNQGDEYPTLHSFANREIVLDWKSSSDVVYLADTNFTGVTEVRIAEGKMFYANGKVYESGVLTSGQIEEIGYNKLFPISGVAFENGENGVKATIAATADAPLVIPTDVSVNEVVLNRTFNAGVFSSIVLPFSVARADIPDAQFYKFVGIQRDNNGNWGFAVKSKFGDNLEANQPYVLMPKEENLTFKFEGAVTLNTETDHVPQQEGNWKLVGSYEFKQWLAGDPEIGNAYGIAGEDQGEVKAGDFVKVADGASVAPTCTYLLYSKAMNLAAKGGTAAGSVSSALPDVIDIVVVDEGEEQPMVIGEFNTHTGEMLPADDRWFDMNGRVLNTKPTQKGIYLHNGKRIVIK